MHVIVIYVHFNGKRGGSEISLNSTDTRLRISLAAEFNTRKQAAQIAESKRLTRRRSFIGDIGFNAFTSGIKAGWYRELTSRKFRQVRSVGLSRAVGQ